MITFATLKDYTPQQVFDQSVSRILAQGEKCLVGRKGGDACAYRSDDFKQACAAGHLMSDAEAQVLIDNNMNTGTNADRAYKYLMGWGTDEAMADMPHNQLIRELQGVHDGWPIKDWPAQFNFLAMSRSLNSDVITLWRAAQ